MGQQGQQRARGAVDIAGAQERRQPISAGGRPGPFLPEAIRLQPVIALFPGQNGLLHRFINGPQREYDGRQQIRQLLIGFAAPALARNARQQLGQRAPLRLASFGEAFGMDDARDSRPASIYRADAFIDAAAAYGLEDQRRRPAGTRR